MLDATVSANGVSMQPASKVLTEEERLRIENFYLKIENIRLQQERMQSDLAKSVGLFQQLQREATEYQRGLNEKYGVELAKCKVAPDGTITPG